jgi:hypothetical protein
MSHELIRRIESLPARRAPSHNYAPSALRDTWRVFYECVPIMFEQFLLREFQSRGLVHMTFRLFSSASVLFPDFRLLFATGV